MTTTQLGGTANKRLALVHISDLHVRHNTDLTGRFLSAATAVTKHLEAADQVLVLITGDIAFSGRQAEYATFQTQLAAFMKDLETRGARRLGVYIVPGNHDRDHELIDAEVLDALAGKIAAGVTSVGIVKTLAAPHVHYFTLEGVLNPAFKMRPDSLVKFADVAAPIGSISIVGLNTAFCARKYDDPGSIDTAGFSPEPPDADLTLLLMHHPTAWMTVTARKYFQRVIAPRFGLIFTGHEHSADEFDVSRSDGRSTKYVEGGVFFENGQSGSSFNIVDIAHDEDGARRFRLTTFSMDDGEQDYSPMEGARWVDVPDGQLGRRWNALSETFRDYLEGDADATQSMVLGDRRPEGLRIDRLLSNSNLKKDDEPQKLSEQMSFSGRKTLVIGEEKSGKTTLASTIFLRQHDIGELPLLIDANKVLAANAPAMERHFQDLVDQQYRDLKASDYFAKERKLRVAIVDNHHAIAVSDKRSELLNDALNKHFATVVSFVDSALVTGAIFAAHSDAFVEYERFELLPLDRAQVRQLTRLWCRSNKDIAPADVEARSHQLYQSIDAILADPIIPSYPFFVLSLLAQTDSGRAPRAGTSTQGYVYENMLVASILRAVEREKLLDIENVIQYASHLAVHCYDRSDVGLEVSELEVFHRRHITQWGLSVDYLRMIDVLIRASIMDKVGDRYEFKFKFGLYYFVGRQIADAIDEPANAARLDQLVSQMHTEAGANIVAFAAHRAGENNKREIVEKVILAASAIFDSRGESSLTTDLRAHFGVATPHLIPARPVVDEGKNVGAVKASDSKPQARAPATRDLEAAPNEYLRAIRSISIVGQIVRGFQGKLKADEKSRLIGAAVGLALRTICDLEIRLIEASGPELDAIADEIVAAWESGNLVPPAFKAEWAKARSPDARKKIVKDKLAVAFLSIAELSFSALFRQTSRSLGSSQTIDLLNAALEAAEAKAAPGNRAYQLLLLSNRLEFGGEFPEAKIVKLHSDFRKDKNVFGADLVRRMMWLRLVTTSPSFKAVQKVCIQVGIKYSGPRIKKVRYLTAGTKERDKSR